MTERVGLEQMHFMVDKEMFQLRSVEGYSIFLTFGSLEILCNNNKCTNAVVIEDEMQMTAVMEAIAVHHYRTHFYDD